MEADKGVSRRVWSAESNVCGGVRVEAGSGQTGRECCHIETGLAGGAGNQGCEEQVGGRDARQNLLQGAC